MNRRTNGATALSKPILVVMLRIWRILCMYWISSLSPLSRCGTNNRYANKTITPSVQNVAGVNKYKQTLKRCKGSIFKGACIHTHTHVHTCTFNWMLNIGVPVCDFRIRMQFFNLSNALSGEHNPNTNIFACILKHRGELTL